MPDNTANNQPKTNVQSGAAAPAGKLRRQLPVILSVVLIIVVVVGLIWFYRGNSDIASYKYGKLDSYKVPGIGTGKGMTFEKPVEMQALTQLKQYQAAQRFLHDKQLANQKYITLSYEAAGIGYTPPQASVKQADLEKRINKTLTNKSDPNYAAYHQTLETFVKNNVNPRFNFTYQPIQSVTTPNLNSGAWQMQFSGVDPKPISQSTPTKVTGEVIYAVRSNAYYYFLIASVNNNWKNNQKVWQQVIDSLKINQ